MIRNISKATDEVLKEQDAYRRERGFFPSQGIMHRRPEIRQPVYAPGRGAPVPAITWDDALVVWAHLKKHLDPTEDQKDQWFKDKRLPLLDRWQMINYRRTPGLERASEDFDTVNPVRVAGGPLSFVAKLGKAERFPKSEELWGYGFRLAAERDSADPLPSWDSMAIDAVKQAVLDLPENLQAVASRAIDAVTPDPRPWANLFLNMAYLTAAVVGGYILIKRMK